MKYLVESRSTADSNLEPLKLYFDIRENPLADQWREVLVKNFIDKIKKEVNVYIKEVEIIKENVIFKTPGKLN